MESELDLVIAMNNLEAEEYEEIGTAEDLARFKCVKCGSRMDTESDLEDLCAEPFNGTTMTCENEKCGAEYNLDMRIKVTLL